ncbi:TPA: hypothetical protein DEP94_00820 [Candidatus Nomurabacteria bacterium]|nr:hypothetical protein [Candidatus Nomurabacteria bacterium]
MTQLNDPPEPTTAPEKGETTIADLDQQINEAKATYNGELLGKLEAERDSILDKARAAVEKDREYLLQEPLTEAEKDEKYLVKPIKESGIYIISSGKERFHDFMKKRVLSKESSQPIESRAYEMWLEGVRSDLNLTDAQRLEHYQAMSRRLFGGHEQERKNVGRDFEQNLKAQIALSGSVLEDKLQVPSISYSSQAQLLQVLQELDSAEISEQEKRSALGKIQQVFYKDIRKSRNDATFSKFKELQGKYYPKVYTDQSN